LLGNQRGIDSIRIIGVYELHEQIMLRVLVWDKMKQTHCTLLSHWVQLSNLSKYIQELFELNSGRLEFIVSLKKQ
jgi:hypothetical protein